MKTLLLRVVLAGLLAADGIAAMAATPTELISKGQDVFSRCQACHSLARNRTGPRLCGVVGRPAGAVHGFRYSGALQSSGFVWDEERLLAFLEDPRSEVPGTFMGYAGVKDRGERQALLAFLADAASTSECEE